MIPRKPQFKVQASRPRFGSMTGPGAGGTSAREVIARLRQRNPGEAWPSKIWPAIVYGSGALEVPNILGVGVIAKVIGAHGIEEADDLASAIFDDPYGAALETSSMIAGSGYSNEIAAIKERAKQEATSGPEPVRPYGFIASLQRRPYSFGTLGTLGPPRRSPGVAMTRKW